MSEQQYAQGDLHAAARWLGLFVASALPACFVDTVVYEAHGIRNDTRPSAAAGAGGTEGTSDRARVFGCNVAVGAGGAPAIVQLIVGSASEASEWVRSDRGCSEDRDCRSALLTPACNAESTRCVPCAALPERIAYLGNLGSCLTDAIADCCADPGAEQDCVFRRCQSGCGPQ